MALLSYLLSRTCISFTKKLYFYEQYLDDEKHLGVSRKWRFLLCWATWELQLTRNIPSMKNCTESPKGDTSQKIQFGLEVCFKGKADLGEHPPKFPDKMFGVVEPCLYSFKVKKARFYACTTHINKSVFALCVLHVKYK